MSAALALAAAPDTVSGAVHSWDVSTNVDGPGTRFVAFLAGCPLRCLYCHNPDTWSRRSGTPTTAEDLLARIDRYRRFIDVAGGGVTLSGGEPLLQPAFVEAVLRGCRERGLHTALDTAGSVGHLASDALLDQVDLVLLDIKSWGSPSYAELTGGRLAPTLAFARRLAARGQRTWLRFVVVPGHTDRDDVVEGVAGFAASLGCVERVDVLPMHRLATAKYEALGLDDPMADVEPPSPETVAHVREIFTSHGLHAV
ncbi:pyruvate formate-lyase-activating protein [Egicoccus halophilus]|uniref:Pyruvate formate-lyase-activating enzyme n=1 Tax=Egicoccus halophilus TaxID=1670830 RepID=A0A8J3A9A8_9ACTN|nr:pyruvate formate-lyase-activating protein [Egicoccus halophilus]GGI04999.1 pyruvate formate-lyase-activating enzyme [Egicoccus halophilus]